MTGFLTTAPWPTLTFVGAVYLGSIPLTIRAAMRARAAAARRAEPATAPLPAAVPASLPSTAVLPLGESSPPATEWRH
jgi:hypothetical protein